LMLCLGMLFIVDSLDGGMPGPNGSS